MNGNAMRWLGLLLGWLAVGTAQAVPRLEVRTPWTDALQHDAAAPTTVTVDVEPPFQVLLLPHDFRESRQAADCLTRGAPPLPKHRGTEWLQRLRPLLRVIGASPKGSALLEQFVPRVQEGRIQIVAYDSYSRQATLGRTFLSDVRSLYGAAEQDEIVFLEMESESGVLIYHLAYAIQLAVDPAFARRRAHINAEYGARRPIQALLDEMSFLSTRKAYNAAHEIVTDIARQQPEFLPFLRRKQMPGGIDMTQPVPDRYILETKGIDPRVAIACSGRIDD